MTIRTLLLLGLLFSPLLHSAPPETQYISDQLVAPMRSGHTVSHRIMAMLRSGTAMDVLSVNEDGWSQVKYGDKIGWILSRYLMPQASVRDAHKILQEKFATLSINYKQLQQTHENLSTKQQQSEQDKTLYHEEVQRLTQELAQIRETAASALSIQHENKSLKEDMIKLSGDYQTLEMENTALNDRTSRDWFIIGALVFFGAILFGFIAPSLSLKRKNRWDL